MAAAFGFHPLELVPWARRIPASPLRDLAYTFLFNSALAGLFTVFGMLFAPARAWASLAWINFVFAQCIGYAIHAGFAITEPWVAERCRRWGFASRAVFFTSIPLAGVVCGYAIAYALLGWDANRRSVFTPQGLASVVLLTLVISGILAAVLSARERAARSEAAFAAERERVALAERSAALARLEALEAQVEPHFLYNTLAHVAASIDREPALARRMLERLIGWLRTSATRDGSGRSTLGDQVTHARAYLEIVALRMGARLSWSIDVPDGLESRPMPPAILQPLIENAIKHGIEPSVAGGAIAIEGRDESGALVVSIADTGAGFGGGEPFGGSTGVGLSNLRARLDALYRGRARLTLAENAPTGVRATVWLPAEASGD